jgi:hypothetical protein
MATVSLNSRRLEELSVDELIVRRAECHAWIMGPQNDGRLSTDSSAQLDYMGDTIEDIEKLLRAKGVTPPLFADVAAVEMPDYGPYDYPNEPIGGGNPYYRCSACGASDPQVNGTLSGHFSGCEWVKQKRASFTLTPAPAHEN